MLIRNSTRALLLALFLVLPGYALLGSIPSAPDQDIEIEALDGTKSSLGLEALASSSMGPNTARIDFGAGTGRGARFEWGPQAFELTLHSGDRVRGMVRTGDEESLGLELIGAAKADFSIEEIGLVLSLDHQRDMSAFEAPATGDRLWRITPGGFDPLDGFLLGFDTAGITMEGDLGTRTIVWNEVACLWIEALEELVQAPRTIDADGRSPVAVDLVDGSRLRGHFSSLDDGELELVRPGHAALFLGLENLASISLDDERQVFLSDRKWQESGQKSLFGDDFGMRWPARADHAVTGTDLRAGGRVWARGVGVHAPSSLGFEGLGQGAFLRGSVAIDDSVLSVPARGSVVFKVFLDGELAWSSSELTSGDLPVAIPSLPVGDASRLLLQVDMASDSFIGDRANWLDVRLVRP